MRQRLDIAVGRQAAMQQVQHVAPFLGVASVSVFFFLLLLTFVWNTRCFVQKKRKVNPETGKRPIPFRRQTSAGAGAKKRLAAVKKEVEVAQLAVK